MKNPKRIIELRAENIKRLSAVTIAPDGALIVVGGRNAQGKSSVLHAIAYALGGKDAIAEEPLKRGADDGRVILRLDDGTVVRRRFFPGGRTDLEIKDESGHLVTAPQTLLDRLTGKVTFDPLAFRNMDKAKRLAFVQRMVGLTFAEEDEQAAALYQERRDLKRDAERARHEAEGMPEYPNVELVSTVELEAELAKANEVNAAADALKEQAAKLEADAATTRTLLSDLQIQRNALLAQLAALDERIAKGNEVVRQRGAAACDARTRAEQAPRIDVTATATALEQARAQNAKWQANDARSKAMAKARALFDRCEEMTRALEHIQKEKERRIREAAFPVPGMGFTTDGVTLNGLPFEQASDAEQLRASVLMAAALNPTLRVMLVHNGEKLDADGLAQLAQLAEELDLQIWMERVSTGAECSVIIEDGCTK